MNHNLIGIKQMAKKLDVPESWVYSRTRTNDIPHYKVGRQNLFEGGAVMNRIALNFDQVEKYNPPPNPAKLSDSRASGYIAKYGAYSWELDALEPRTMRDLISDTIAQYRDNEIYQQRLDLENEYKRVLHKVEENWKEL
jgi:hypothetical protein